MLPAYGLCGRGGDGDVFIDQKSILKVHTVFDHARCIRNLLAADCNGRYTEQVYRRDHEQPAVLEVDYGYDLQGDEVEPGPVLSRFGKCVGQ